MDTSSDSSSDDDDFIVTALVATFFAEPLLQNQNAPISRPRRFGVHPLQRLRREQGFYDNLNQEMRQHPEKFFNFTRLTTAQFDQAVELITPHMKKRDTFFHRPMSVDMRLFITLRFLATGDSLTSLSYAYRVGKSTCSNIIIEVCEALWEGLADYIKPPSCPEDFRKIADRFSDRWNLPHCIGAVDGKHVKLKAPPNSGSKFFNYKQTFSIVLMAVCDADYCFTMVDIGAEGSQSDGGVFRNSALGTHIKNQTLPEPPACKLPGSVDTLFPFYYVGDEAFALTENFMIPYGKALVAGLGEAQIRRKIFNFRLSRARRIIENTFGILVAKWRIFHTPIQATNENAKLYVQACIALHNFVLKTKNQGARNQTAGPAEDYLTEGAAPQENIYLSPVRVVSNKNAAAKCKALRDTLCDYVNDVNVLDYQRKYVLRGHTRVLQCIQNTMNKTI